MQATDLIIQTREACGDARQMPAAGKCALGHLYRHGAGLPEAFDTPSLPLAFGNAIERNFGRFALAQRIDVLAGVERVFDQFATTAHQLSQQGTLVNRRGEIPRATQSGATARRLSQIGRAPKSLRRLVSKK